MIRAEHLAEARLLRLTLPAVGGGGLGPGLLRAIGGVLRGGVGPDVRAVLVVRDAPDFSLGTDVRFALEQDVGADLDAWTDAVRAVVRCPVPVMSAVRGRCLGRGAAFALASHFLFAHDDTALGFHEVALGLFSPVASALLPWRSPVLRRLLIGGELLDVHQLELAGLVTAVTHRDPALEAEAWFREHLLPRSRMAIEAATAAAAPGPGFEARLDAQIAGLRAHLAGSAEARAGVRAFLGASPREP